MVEAVRYSPPLTGLDGQYFSPHSIQPVSLFCLVQGQGSYSLADSAATETEKRQKRNKIAAQRIPIKILPVIFYPPLPVL
jgi:hypothetical protein